MSIFAERIIPTFYIQKKQHPMGIAFLWRKGWDTAAGGVLTALRPKRPAFWYPFRTFLLKTIIYRFLYAKTLSGFESHLFLCTKKAIPYGIALLEERMGFEPTDAFTSQHFQCCAFNHSATSPKQVLFYHMQRFLSRLF